MRVSDWSADVCSSDLGVLPLLFLRPAAVAGRLAHRARFAAAAHLAAFLVLHTLLEPALCHVLVDLRAAHLATAAHHVHGRLLAAIEGAQDLVDDAIVDARMAGGGRFRGILGTARRIGQDGAAFPHYRDTSPQPANSALTGSLNHL